MEIVWLGHSCFRLRSGELAVITDPYPDSIGLRLGAPTATLVTTSHHHANHSNWEAVLGDPKVIRGPGEYELSGIYVTGVMTPAGPEEPSPKRNTAYLIEMEGLRICHLGDVSAPLTVRDIEELAPVDILLVPAGGRCTVPIPAAIQMAQSLEPRVLVPMHCGLPGLNVDLGTVDVFLREMGLGEVEPQARFNVSATTLPQDMRVVVLVAQGTIS